MDVGHDRKEGLRMAPRFHPLCNDSHCVFIINYVYWADLHSLQYKMLCPPLDLHITASWKDGIP